MIFEDFPKKIILKDSSECEFRIASGDERDKFTDFFKRVSADDLWAMRRDYTKAESVDLYFCSASSDENVTLLAYQEECIIGIGIINFSGFGARKDVGEVEIIVDESFKQKRLGTWLMLEVINIVTTLKLEVLRIELMASKDVAAIIATKRANFVPQAILKNYLKDRNGKFDDLVILIKEIYEESSDY